MKENIFEKIKSQVSIEEVVSYFGVKLNSSKKGLCPFHMEKTPSFSVKPNDNIFTCFGCGATGDCIDFVAKLKNIELIDAAKMLSGIYHIEIEYDKKHKKLSKHKINSIANFAEQNIEEPKEKGVNRNLKENKSILQENRKKIKEYLLDCISHVFKCDYFAKRGLNMDTIKKFYLGYDKEKKQIVIPYSSKLIYYQARSIESKSFFKPKTEYAGSEPLYNKQALYNKTFDPVFIVESPICALSIMQFGSLAIATCGTNGINKLVKELQTHPTSAIMIICMDNDEAGQKASEELSKKLEELQAKYYVTNIAEECKDSNELLIQDSDKLSNNILKAKREAIKKYKTNKDSITAFELQTTKIEEPNWIIEKILCEGVTFLCAPSKIGKSWMVLQMCLSISSGNEFLGYKTKKSDCLYYALEDSRYRIKYRMDKILQNTLAPDNFHISIESVTLDMGLIEQLENEMNLHPKIGLIAIDTFQKIRGKAKKNETAYANDYSEITIFKRFASKHKISILLVHHLRKATDEADIFNKVNGSMALMAAADSMWIIDKKKRSDETAELHMTGRDIMQNDLVIKFIEQNCIWQKVGTTEEEAENRKEREYNENPIVKVIKHLVENNINGYWEGSASDFIVSSCDVLGHCIAETPTSLGKKLPKLRYKLYEKGIECNQNSGRKQGRKWIFQLKSKKKIQINLFNEDFDDS